jgi:hypothetical protein
MKKLVKKSKKLELLTAILLVKLCPTYFACFHLVFSNLTLLVTYHDGCL